MRFVPLDPPRTFRVGRAGEVVLHDCGRVALAPGEQVTFTTPDGAEYDVARTVWGFYATPSLNDRLPTHRLRAALVRSQSDRYYVILVEAGKDDELRRYMAAERQELVSWLDTAGALAQLAAAATSGAPERLQAPLCLCGARDYEPAFTYDAPPPGEVRFKFSSGTAYRREILRCRRCGHFVSLHAMKTGDLYAGDYVHSTYGGVQGLRTAFDRINRLDPEKSDNVGRVQRVVSFAEPRVRRGRAKTVLDVGSGLCVFLHRMKQAGWTCTAIDPDPDAVRHAKETVGVEAVQADFLQVQGLSRYQLITFNKVLEHVPHPVEMLQKAAAFLEPGGLVYVEVPDGEAAFIDGPNREEFFIDHPNIFSAASLSLLARRAGYSVLRLDRIRDPSGKYTLYTFLSRTPPETTHPAAPSHP